MPKPYTLPDLFDDVKRISIADLRKWGYLIRGKCKHGTVTWRRDGLVTSSISIVVDMDSCVPKLKLSYQYNGQVVNYNVPLVSVPSNLGKGEVWYFICPSTGKQCRVLYFGSGRFLHREAFKDCMYRKQTYSHNGRLLMRVFDAHLDGEDAETQMCSKYFRTHYNGLPTRRYEKLTRKAERAIKDVDRLTSLYLS